MPITNGIMLAAIIAGFWGPAAMTAPPAAAPDQPSRMPLPDLTDAEPQVRRLIEDRYRTVLGHPDNADAWGGYAVACHAHGLTAIAEPAYAEAHALQNDEFRWVYLPGVMLFDHAPRRALTLLEAARNIDPDYVPAMLRVGVLYEQAGRIEDARSLYAEAAARQPNNPAARFYHGQCLLRRNDAPAALRELEAAAKLAPGARSILATLVRAYRMTGNKTAAQAASVATADATSNQVLIDPIYEQVRFEAVSVEAYRQRGWALLESGRTTDALAAFEQGLIYSPNHFSMLRGLIMANVRLDRHDAAIDAYNRALLLEPDDSVLARGLAASLAAMRQYEESKRSLQAALAKHPDDADILNDLAWLLATCPDDAIRDGIEAVRLAERVVAAPGGRTPSAMDTLAAAFAEAGRFDDAVRTMREAVDQMHSAGADNDAVNRYMQRLLLYKNHESYRQ